MRARAGRGARGLLRGEVWLLVGVSACVSKPLNLGYNSVALTLESQTPLVVAQDGKDVTTISVKANLSQGETLFGVQLLLVPDAGAPAVALPPSLSTQPPSIAGNVATINLQVADPTSPPDPGELHMIVTANAGARPIATQPFDVEVAVVEYVGPPVGTTGGGVNGRLAESMGTSFQPADWQGGVFGAPASTEAADGGVTLTQASGGAGGSNATLLSNLQSGLVVVQLMNGGAIPLVGWTHTAADWQFAELDRIVQPLLGADSGAEVELQIKDIPSIIPGTGSDPPDGGPNFATYCEDLVSYYNVDGGFQWGDAGFKSPTPGHIRWWGILADWNTPPLSLSAGDYADTYNTVVQAMRSADPTIQFSGFELADLTPGTGQSPAFLSTFLGGVSQPIDVVSLHMFGTSNWQDPDAQILEATTLLAQDIKSVVGTVSAMVSSSTPVWVTENNVNSDAPAAGGMSADNFPNYFQDDPRGTNAFFAAWRPYVFAALGRAGNQRLVHWDFTSGRCPATTTQFCAPVPSDIDAASLDTDTQNAEVDYSTGIPYLSYWVDQWLGTAFPPTALSAAPFLLSVQSTEVIAAATAPSVDVLATQNDGDGSVTIMVTDLGPASLKSNSAIDGTSGAKRYVIVDLGSYFNPPGSTSATPPSFSSESIVRIDGATDTEAGPGAEQTDAGLPTANSPRITIDFPNGYGVAFVKLTR